MKKVLSTVLSIALLTSTLSFATVEETYGDVEMKWRTYVTDGPAVAFAVFNDELWYATSSAVGKYSMKVNQKSLVQELGDLPSSGVTSMAAGKGSLWIGTAGGLAQTQNGKTFTVYTTDNGLVSNTVNRVKVIKNDVWVATDKGVSVYSGGSWKSYTTADGLCGANVRDMTEAKSGKIWCATNNGIAIFDPSAAPGPAAWAKKDMSSGMGSNDVKAIAYDPREKLVWVADGSMDVESYNGKEWESFMDIMEDIRCIMIDTQSRVWVGSTMSGLQKYNGFEWVRDPQKLGFGAAEVHSMYRDSKGDLFFALETGVLHMQNPYPY